MNRQLIPKGADATTVEQFAALHKRLREYREQEAQALALANPEASANTIESMPKDVQDLQVQHAVEFVVRTEQAMADLTGEMQDLKSRLDKALRDQAFAEGDREKMEAAYKALRDKVNVSNVTVTPSSREGQQGNLSNTPAGNAQTGDAIERPTGQGSTLDPMELVRKEIEAQVAAEVGKRVSQITARTPTTRIATGTPSPS